MNDTDWFGYNTFEKLGTRMKVCLLQLKVAKSNEHIEQRLEHIEAILNSRNEENIDFILLPETAFSSYCIPDPKSALKVAKEQETFIKSWGQNLAPKLKCYIAFGFIGLSKTTGYAKNTLIVVSPSGVIIHEQTKRFLYDSDLNWTRERNSDFPVVELTELRGFTRPIRALFGICNDINGFDFSPEEMSKFALARAALDHKVDVLFLSTAWCSAHPDSPSWAHDQEVLPKAQLDYWLERLEPLIGSRCFFCVADLVGREPIPKRSPSKIRYCGTSCAINLKNSEIIDYLDTSTESALTLTLPYQDLS